jgi:chromosome partitioning protein
MKKAIVFPVNNKGGVGKTSLLVDLAASIAQRNSVGLIDTDHQASMAGTFLGHKELTCLSLDDYLAVEPCEVTLLPEVSLGFLSAIASMRLDIQATKAKLGVFPVGILYERPRRRARLERILNRDFSDREVIMVDLPPIPHPAMVLDYSIMPIVNILRRVNLDEVNLFPLIVSTIQST